MFFSFFKAILGTLSSPLLSDTLRSPSDLFPDESCSVFTITVLVAAHSQNKLDRTESQNRTVWVGRDLKDLIPTAPAMSRDIFHYSRSLRAPPNLALNTSREGAATASLGNLGQCFTTLMGCYITNHNRRPKTARGYDNEQQKVRSCY